MLPRKRVIYVEWTISRESRCQSKLAERSFGRRTQMASTNKIFSLVFFYLKQNSVLWVIDIGRTVTVKFVSAKEPNWKDILITKDYSDGNYIATHIQARWVFCCQTVGINVGVIRTGVGRWVFFGDIQLFFRWIFWRCDFRIEIFCPCFRFRCTPATMAGRRYHRRAILMFADQIRQSHQIFEASWQFNELRSSRHTIKWPFRWLTLNRTVFRVFKCPSAKQRMRK